MLEPMGGGGAVKGAVRRPQFNQMVDEMDEMGCFVVPPGCLFGRGGAICGGRDERMPT